MKFWVRLTGRAGTRQGWTLIEMLVALTLFSIVAVSLNSVLQASLRSWRASEGVSGQDRRTRAFYRIFSRDLVNAIPYGKNFEFRGSADHVEWLTSERGTEGRVLVRVAYDYERNRHRLVRRAAGLEKGFDPSRAVPAVLVEGVQVFEMGFIRKGDVEAGTYRTLTAWDSESDIPRGVRVKLDDSESVCWAPLGVSVS